MRNGIKIGIRALGRQCGGATFFRAMLQCLQIYLLVPVWFQTFCFFILKIFLYCFLTTVWFLSVPICALKLLVWRTVSHFFFFYEIIFMILHFIVFIFIQNILVFYYLRNCDLHDNVPPAAVFIRNVTFKKINIYICKQLLN